VRPPHRFGIVQIVAVTVPYHLPSEPASFRLVLGIRVSSAPNHDAEIRAHVRQHWEASERGESDTEHAIYAVDAILDYPQSGERFRGRERIKAQRGGHPAERHFTIRRIVGSGDLWLSECLITYDGTPTYSLSVMEFTDDLVTHETQYFADPFQASPRRAALAEPIPARDHS
jgi:hypothetical protein